MAAIYAPLALAQTPEAAAEYFDRAMEHVKRREFELAVADFQRAHQLDPNHAVLYNLAQVYAAMDRPVDALRTFHECLAIGGAELDAARIARINELVEGQERKVAMLRFDVEPKDAAVTVDGEAIAPLPDGSVPVAPKHVHISVSADGYQSTSRDFSAEAGTQVPMQFRLDLVEPATKEKTLRLACDVDNVEVIGDGQLLTTLRGGLEPESVRVPEDLSSLRFERTGYVANHVSLAGVAEASVVDCGLQPPPVVVGQPVAAQAESRAPRRNAWALALAGTGVGLGLTAGVIWLYNGKRAGDWGVGYCSGLDATVVDCGTGMEVPQSEREGLFDERDSIQRWDAIAQGLVIGSLVAVGGAAAVYFWPETSKNNGKRAQSSFTLTPRSVRWQYSF